MRTSKNAAMPLPRLDLQSRRNADQRAGDGRRPEFQSRGNASRPHPDRHVGTTRVREPGRKGAAAFRGSGRHSGARRSVPVRVDALRDAQGMGHRLQLEDLRRQLSRGLSRPGHPSRAAQGARLRQLQGRAASLLLHPARAAPRDARRQCGRAALRPREDGYARGAVRMAVPQHDAEHLHGADADEHRHPHRARPLQGGLRVVLRQSTRRSLDRLAVDEAPRVQR